LCGHPTLTSLSFRYIWLPHDVSLNSQTRLKLLTGRGAKFRVEDVLQRASVLGDLKFQGFIGLHNFTGADWERQVYWHLQEDMGIRIPQPG